jgi:hypothetical protein
VQSGAPINPGDFYVVNVLDPTFTRGIAATAASPRPGPGNVPIIVGWTDGANPYSGPGLSQTDYSPPDGAMVVARFVVFNAAHAVIDGPTDFNLTWYGAGAQMRLNQLVLSGGSATIADVLARLPPKAYVLSTVHAGLTSHGTLVLAGPSGVLVTATTVPTGWGKTAATAPRYVPSWLQLTWGDAHGMVSEELLHYLDEVRFSPTEFATTLGYSIGPGWSADITELVGS